MKVEQSSREYWQNCLYESNNQFHTEKTSEIPLDNTEKLREYASNAFMQRDNSVAGESYYYELKRLHGWLEGKTVLDFGCGQGIDALHMATHGAIVSVADIVPSNIKLANHILQWHKHYSYVIEDYSDIKNIGSSDYLTKNPPFDMILSNGCLHHINDDAAGFVVKELCKLLQPNGLFLAMIYTRKLHSEGKQTLTDGWARGYDKDEFTALFGKEMKLVDYRVFCNGHFSWFVLQKSDRTFDWNVEDYKNKVLGTKGLH